MLATACGTINVLSTNLFFFFCTFSTTFGKGLYASKSPNSSLKVILFTASFKASLGLCLSLHIFHLDSGDPSFLFFLRKR